MVVSCGVILVKTEVFTEATLTLADGRMIIWTEIIQLHSKLVKEKLFYFKPANIKLFSTMKIQFQNKIHYLVTEV